MTTLYNKYKAKGFTILAFPCNQFGGQEPGSNAEIKEFATSKYAAEYPMFSKIDVKGSQQSPVYTHLLKCFPGDVTWNFASLFLIARDGVPKLRFDKSPWKDVEAAIRVELGLPE
eukprot:gb/GEZN01013911.1/.p1 GENE.gb/GEZN01013911.1/~~gb/GEZN01013911.1/.p1  ORF type:complete len:115 (-),score=17.22 gb/GEZN01013911.1/:305-649(-)